MTLWNMPHGIILLISLMNNNCYLLFEQPSSHHSHATSRASLSLASSSHNLHTLTKSLHSEPFYALNQLLAKNSISITTAPHQRMPAPHPGCSTSHQPQKELTPLLALHISVRDAFLTTHVLPSHLSETLTTNASSSHTHQSALKFFIAEMGFWLRIALIQLAHLPKGASTRPRVPYCSPQHNGLATLLELLLIAVRDPLLTTSSHLPSPLLLVISSNLPSLSPTWPAINSYLIIIIILKRDWQCKAGRERLTPYQSEEPNPTTPTLERKKRKGKQ